MVKDKLIKKEDVTEWLKINDRSISWLAMQANVHPVYLSYLLRGNGNIGQVTSDKLNKIIGK